MTPSATTISEIHAGNFMFHRQKQLEYLASIMDRKPIVVAPYHSGAMAEYATRRIKLHLQRFQRLTREIEANVIDEAWLSAIEDQDNIFTASVLAAA